jgi:hypothetical protein
LPSKGALDMDALGWRESAEDERYANERGMRESFERGASPAILPLMARAFIVLVSLLAIACAPDPVKWDSEKRTDVPIPPGARLILQAGDVPAIAQAWKPPAIPAGTPQCDGSVVATPARGDTAFAAWWAPRPDSSALLVVARSDDRGRTWRAPEIADSTDKGHTGCRRPAPFIAADTLNGYVHVVYFMVAAEGPGVFFTHSMGGGEMFHSPVPIVYGERVSPAAVACNGDTVAVAYVDPNSSNGQIWLALSRTTGHIFEERVPVSPAPAEAERPAVAVRGHRVAVAWFETSRGGDSSSAGVTVVRTGRWQ